METRDRIGIVAVTVLLAAAIFTFIYMCQSGSLPLITYAQSVRESQNISASGDASQFFEDSDEENDDIIYRLPLAEGVSEDDVDISMNYVIDTLYLNISGIDDKYLSSHPLSGSSTHINDLIFVGDQSGYGYEITFDAVYDYTTYVEGGNLCIKLMDPHELYDFVVVIDPGHGGSDSPGTVWNGVLESEITLDIGNEIMEYKDELAQMGIGLYTTRTQDVYTYLRGRVAMANEMNADLFLSIHCNALNGYGDNETSGVESLYNQKDKTGASRALAMLCSTMVSGVVDARDRGALKGNDVYIVRKSKVPVALCEVGFMSNVRECYLLQTKDYQQKLAKGFIDTIKYVYENGLDTESALESSDADSYTDEADESIVSNEND